MKKLFVLCIGIVMISSAAIAQADTVQQKDPGVNEFVFVDQEPRPVNMEEIRKKIGYPQKAREQNIEGTVILRILVDEKGNYSRHKLVNEGDPLLVRAVEAHVNELKFSPGMRNGKAIRFWVNIPFRFKLMGEEEVEAQIRELIAQLDKQISSDPADYKLYYQRGLKRIELAETKEALGDFTRSISLNPLKNKKKFEKSTYETLILSLHERGKVYFGQDSLALGFADMKEALRLYGETKARTPKLDTTASVIYLEMGYVHALNEEYDAALNDLDRSMAMNPDNDCLIHELKSDILIRQKKYRELIPELDAAIGCSPENVSLYYNRAFYQMELEEWEAALPDFEKVTRLTKEDLLKADALVRISFLKHKLGRNKEALQDVETAIGLNAFNVHAYYYKGLILIGLGELEKGCEELKDALLLGLEGTEKTGAEALIAENCGE